METEERRTVRQACRLLCRGRNLIARKRQKELLSFSREMAVLSGRHADEVSWVHVWFEVSRSFPALLCLETISRESSDRYRREMYKDSPIQIPTATLPSAPPRSKQPNPSPTYQLHNHTPTHTFSSPVLIRLIPEGLPVVPQHLPTRTNNHRRVVSHPITFSFQVFHFLGTCFSRTSTRAGRAFFGRSDRFWISGYNVTS